MRKRLKKIKSLYLLVQIFKRYLTILRLANRFPSARIDSSVKIINSSSLELGNNVELQHHVTLHCGGNDWCNNTGFIKIGDNSILSNDVIIWGCGAKVIIGKNFDCAPGVKIFSSRTDYLHKGKRKHIFDDVIIGDNVICYANVVINPGVKIGNDSVIGANSVVLNDVSPNTLVAGAPAKMIKNRIK